MTKLRQIYLSRAQCAQCGLDKMLQYYRIPNATPSAMHQAHKKELRKRFKEKYGCEHKITFSREIVKEYLWDLDTNTAVKRAMFK